MRTCKTAGHLIRNDKIKKAAANFINTCAFDSFLACLCTLYRDTLTTDEMYSSEIKSNTFQLVDYLTKKGHDKKAEALKDFILSGMFKEKLKIFKIIDCNNNVSFFVDKLQTKSYILIKTCDCGLIKKVYPFIHLSGETNKKIRKNLETLVADVTPKLKIKCSKGHLFKINVEFFENICLTTTIFDQTNQLELLKNQIIPEKIYIQNNCYMLKCIINFKPPNIPSGIGHYQAYCRSPLGVWEVFDNSNSNVLKPKKFVIPHLFVFSKYTT